MIAVIMPLSTSPSPSVLPVLPAPIKNIPKHLGTTVFGLLLSRTLRARKKLR